MANLIVSSNKEPEADGRVAKVSPDPAGWEHLGFEVLRLGEGEAVERETGDEDRRERPLAGEETPGRSR